MKINKILSILLLMLALASCSPSAKDKDERTKFTDQLEKKCIKAIKNNHKLFCSGKGGGGVDSLHTLALSFDSSSPLYDLEIARDLIKSCVSLCEKELLETPEIIPFLKDPSSQKNLFEIRVFFPKGQLEKIDIRIVSFIKGTIKYKTDVKEDVKMIDGTFKTLDRLKTLHSESWGDS
jgi:hypothetical protein